MLEGISATDIAVSGVRAQRIRMNIIANNIANAQSTRTPQGGPFRRQLAVFQAEQLQPILDPDKFGVKVQKIVSDMSPFRTVFDPSHPDADADGMVSYPNVNLATEMIDLLSAQRAYEANINIMLSSRQMGNKALEIIQA
jgi:flagellar basal-body rod protein FlgC